MDPPQDATPTITPPTEASSQSPANEGLPEATEEEGGGREGREDTEGEGKGEEESDENYDDDTALLNP